MTAIELPPEWRRRALVLRETTIVLDWFDGEELAEANGMKQPKRRAEWLLSRAAAKMLAVERGLAATPAGCRIADRRTGSAYVSLSHSAPYAGAAIDGAPIGIDVEVVRPLNERGAHLFLTDDEIAAMEGVAIDDRMIHFWAAKEATWKRLGGSTGTLKRVPLTLLDVSRHGLTFDVVETFRKDDLVIALTRPTS